jgi:Cu+-exporting ATPase
MRKVDTLVVDKTGTLTEGKPRLVTVEVVPGGDPARLLRVAAALERGSEHPLAAAIVAAAGSKKNAAIVAGARERGIAAGNPAKGAGVNAAENVVTGVADFVSVTGRGVTGRVDGVAVALGNRALLQELRVADAADLLARAEQLSGEGQTVVFVVIDGRAAGLLGVADPIKASTPSALAQLRNDGVRIVMLTGDSRATAQAVARTLGITEVISEVLPQDKAGIVRKLQGEGRFVAMAGDGINDAPALAQAQIGIAMGTGTDVAIASAGVTLVKGDLRGIARARALSRATMRNIKQNLFWAFVYNSLGVPVAAGVLYPFFGILLSPMIAAAAMSFSSVSVISNALRLRRVRLG